MSNVRFAVSHSERTDLSEPAYLLPKEHQLANVVIAGSLSENELAALFIKQKEAMTGQAKARGSSPFWEGVVVLSDTDSKVQSANLQAWKVAYEQATGHKVLHMSVHLDEGYIDTAGKPQYNPHAHVIASRMDDKNRVIKLERKELAAVQDLTAIALKMERGSTLAERGGKRGRRHVGHKEYRAQADEVRLDLDKEKFRTALEGRLTDTLSRSLGDTKNKLKEAKAEAAKVPKLTADLGAAAQQIAQLNEQYRLDRDAMKASGEAKQADYQALKKAHEATLEKLASTQAELTETKEKVETMTHENDDLKAKLDAKTEADRVRFAAMAQDYQAEKEAGVPAHLVVPSPSSNPDPAQPVAPAPTKTPAEAPKAKTLPTHLPAPEKSLIERLEASLRGLLDWIKGKGWVQEPVGPSTRHDGPVVQLDDLHCVQKTGRAKFAIHELGKLDRVPALDDSKTEISYRGGVGQVKGRGVGKGGRAD